MASMVPFQRLSLLFVILVQAVLGGVVTLSGVIRDQAPAEMTSCGSAGSANNGAGWPGTDFQAFLGDDHGIAGKCCNAQNGWTGCGVVSPTDRTPQYASTGGTSTTHSAASFYNWYHDTAQNIKIPFNFDMSTVPGTNSYQQSNMSFFPIDNQGWGDHCQADDGNQHNFAFCFEAHTFFGFTGPEVFNFCGDDDVFVYIDDLLVIDLGGVHSRECASVTLADIPWIKPGNNYRLDFFYCERHTTASDITLTTTLELYCPLDDWCGQCSGNGQSCCTPQLIAQYCNDNNSCTQDLCGVTVSPQNGGCQHVNITCPAAPDHCTLSYCDPASGCVTSPVICNDGNGCTTDTCNPSSGCVFTNACNPPNPCYLASCLNNTCVYTHNTCDDGNICTTDSCNNATGCVHQPCASNNSCSAATCNSTGCHISVIGNCLCANVTCNQTNTDPCHPMVCNPQAGACQLSNYSCDDGNACTTDTCVVVGKAATCSNILKNCSTDACNPGTCNSTTGQCMAVNTSTLCDDGNACTLDSFVCFGPNNASCTHIPNGASMCNDTDMCTNDFCNATNPTSPCYTTPVVCSPNTCQLVGPCNSSAGCTYLPKPCPDTGDYCIAPVCDVNAGCINTTRVCTVDDPICYIGVCDSALRNCTKQQRPNFATIIGPGGVLCPLIYDQAAKAGAIAAGAVAGIAIGAAAVAGLAAFGGKKGVDFYRAKQMKSTNLKTNPLYEQSKNQGLNQLYVNKN